MKLLLYTSVIIIGTLLQYTGLILFRNAGTAFAKTLGLSVSVFPVVLSLLSGILTPVCSSLFAAHLIHPEFALSFITGFNVSVILFILGLTALINPYRMRRAFIKFEVAILFLTAVVFHVFSLDGKIGSSDGIIFVIFAAYFLLLNFLKNRSPLKMQYQENEKEKKKSASLLLIIAGIILPIAGSLGVVYSSAQIINITGINIQLMAFFVVPSIILIPYFFKLLFTVRRNADINTEMEWLLQGSLFSFLIVVGFIALLKPVNIDSIFYRFNNYIMIGSYVLLTLFLIPVLKLSRVKGAVLFVLYLLFAVNSVFKIVC